MNDLLLMNVPDARDKLRKKFASVFFFQVAMGQDVVEELASDAYSRMIPMYLSVSITSYSRTIFGVLDGL